MRDSWWTRQWESCGPSPRSPVPPPRRFWEVAAGKPFVVPGLWMFEVANGLLVLMRRKKILPQQCARARGALSRLHPVVDDDGPRLALHRIWEFADEFALSIYDAVYLELAQRKGLPLASRDAGLRRAAAKCGVPLLL